MNTEQLADLRNLYHFALLMLRGLVDDLTPDGERTYRNQESEVKRLHDRIYYAEQKCTERG